MDAEADTLSGTAIERYRIEARLGSGGMGIVYRAFDPRLQRPVAIKVMRSSSLSNPRQIQRFLLEARSVSALNHPHICMIHDAGDKDGLYYLVLEYVEGETLRAILEREGRVPAERVIELGIQVCSALAAAHQKGIIHRDIKPENLMITASGAAKVMDFGLAKLKIAHAEAAAPATEAAFQNVPGNTFMTALSGLLGTAAYMSPEQIQRSAVDERTDLFSLGMVLQEALTGRHPFKGSTPLQMMKAIVRDQPEELPRELPEALRKVIAKSLARHPGERYASAAAMSKALAAAGAAASRPHFRRWKAIVSLASVFFLAVIILVLMSRPRQEADAIAPIKLQPVGLTMEKEEWPSFSPDGRALLYSVKNAGKFEQRCLRLRHLDRARAVNLLRSPVDIFGVDWSPDGHRMAYTAVSIGLFVADTSGANPQKIAETGYTPRWSPDGNHLVYSSNPPNSVGADNVIWLVSLQSGTTEIISPRNSLKYCFPSWSPDGKWIAACGGEGSIWEIWLIDMRDRRARQLTRRNEWIKNPIWCPDGRHILFIANTNGYNEVWRLPVDPEDGRAAGEPHQLTSGADIDEIDIAAGSGRLVVTRADCESELWRLLMSGDPARPLQKADIIANLPGTVENLELSPDRTHLAIELLERGVRYFVIRSLTDSSESSLHDRQNIFAPAWSADGVRIAFDRGGGNNADIWWTPYRPLVRLGTPSPSLAGTPADKDGTASFSHGQVIERTNGGQIPSTLRPQPELLIASPGADWMPAFSPDGRQLAFLSNRSGSFQIWLQDLQTNTARQLTHSRKLITRPSWSHDGKKIAFIESEQGQVGWICVYDLQKEMVEKIQRADYLSPDMTQRCRWSEDDKALFFFVSGEYGVLWKVNVADRVLRKYSFRDAGYPLYQQTFDLDGNLGYFIILKEKKDIWIAEEPE